MWPTHAAAILDVRRDESRSDQRYIRVMATANEVKPGEHFILIAPSEPIPLYGVLSAHGFSHAAEHVGVDEWVVQFTRNESHGHIH